MSRVFFRLAAATVLLGCLAACGVEQKVSEPDKAIFLRAEDLGRFGFRYENAAAYEIFSKTRHFDGTYDLKYTFTTPKGDPHPLYIFISVSVGNQESDAVVSERAEKIGLLIGFKKEGIEEREVAGALPHGDSSRFAIMIKDGNPIGNTFSVRDGRKTYLLVMSGLYFQDPALWRTLIEPKLRQLSGFSPA